MTAHLSLVEAIKTGQLDEFSDQEEARGVPAAAASEFIAVIREVVKSPRSADRTSRSPSSRGSTGK
jgi:hypothetical protein